MRAPFAAVVLATTVIAANVRAQEAAPPDAPPPAEVPGDACLDAFGKAQALRRQAELRAARRQLLLCAQTECVDVVEQKCKEWLDEIERDQPTLVISIDDERGEPPTGARVLIDGEEDAMAATGRAIPIDPGTHMVRVVLPSGASKDALVTVLQGQKNQPLSLSFAPPKPVPPPPPPPRVTIVREDTRFDVPAIVAFVVAGVASASGVVTGAIALADADDLEEQCATEGCTDSEIDRGLGLAHASTVSFAIAGAALATGVAFLLIPDEDETIETGWRAVVSPAGVALRASF